MHPFLFQSVPLYFVMWGCAIVAGVGGGTIAAARAGFSIYRSVAALLLITVILMAGSKLLYTAEAHWFPSDDYVPLRARGLLHGFRIPGGILLLGMMMPLICWLLRLPSRRFGDVAVLAVAAALVLVRTGCFLNGCCFGRVSRLPWALSFPRGSWVFWYHRAQGWIPEAAERSLPVHPLQIYFLVAAAASFALVAWRLRAPHRPGSVQLLFYALFLSTTAALEPLRANSLTLNNWLAPVGAALLVCIFVERRSGTVDAASERLPT